MRPMNCSRWRKRTHDLSLLLRLLEDAGEEIEPFWPLLGLNPFDVQFRYEVAGEDFADLALVSTCDCRHKRIGYNDQG